MQVDDLSVSLEESRFSSFKIEFRQLPIRYFFHGYSSSKKKKNTSDDEIKLFNSTFHFIKYHKYLFFAKKSKIA